MAKEPHPNYDPDAIRLSLGVFGKLFEKGSPVGKLTLAFVGGVAVIIAIMVMAAFANVANACHHNAETAEQTSTEAPRKDDQKTEVKA